MTIYAIVDALLDHENPDHHKGIWTLISGAGIVQGGNPYFVPDFAKTFEARIALAVKIGKLGKGIARRFAYRYVDSVAPAVIFLATDLLADLRSKGLPWTPAISYDRCLAIGQFEKFPTENLENSNVGLQLQSVNGVLSKEWRYKDASPDIEDAISRLSLDNTLKTGDLILLGLTGSGPAVVSGMRATLSFNDKQSLKFNIR